MFPYPLELENVIMFDEKKNEYVLLDSATEEEKELFEEHKKLLEEGVIVRLGEDGEFSIEIF